MGKIYFRIQSLFQPLVVFEFWPVIRGYCFHVMLVRQQHAVYGSRNALGILAFLQFPYHGEPRAALNQCDHGPLVACSDDQVHLSIPMPCSVCLRRSLVYAGAAFDGHVLSSRALAVLQPKSVIRIWDKYKYVKKIHFYSIFLAKTLGFSMIIRIFAATELVCIPSELQASHFL